LALNEHKYYFTVPASGAKRVPFAKLIAKVKTSASAKLVSKGKIESESVATPHKAAATLSRTKNVYTIEDGEKTMLARAMLSRDCYRLLEHGYGFAKLHAGSGHLDLAHALAAALVHSTDVGTTPKGDVAALAPLVGLKQDLELKCELA